MRIIESLDARIKSYLLTHFEKTKYGKNLAQLKNIHNGKRCFIIGNGPSLSPDDLEMLKNEYCFAFNRIYLIFDKTSWRPSFYCIQDEKMACASINEVMQKIQTPYFFAPINLRWYFGLNYQTNYYFAQKSPPSEDIAPDFCEDIPHQIGVGNTVVFTAMQLAAYMGFEEIYLIGVDHNFRKTESPTGEIKIDNSVKDYFCEEYNQDEKNLYIPTVEYSTIAYMAAQKYADAHGIKIYNATRGGKLEVFPRVDFDTLFEQENREK